MPNSLFKLIIQIFQLKGYSKIKKLNLSQYNIYK